MVKKNFQSGLDMLIQSTVPKTERPSVGICNADAPSPPRLPSKKSTLIEKTTPKEPERQLIITVPESLKRRIKNYCVNNDITIKELFTSSVIAHMDQSN